MKRIPLTQGQFAIIDDKNYNSLNQYKWYAWWSKSTKSFYARRNNKKEKGKQYVIYMAREILGLKKGDKRQSDHINHKTLDNRESNLWAVTLQQNRWNQKNPKGYYWDKRAKRYYAMIRLNGKAIYLGCFVTAKEARNAYLQAKERYHEL